MSFQECHGPASSSKRGRLDSSFRAEYSIPSTLNKGSDTEEEDNTEIEEYYLNRAKKKRGVDIVFRKTVYTHIEEQTFDDEVLASEKREHQQWLPISSSKCHDVPISAQIFRVWMPPPYTANESPSATMLPNNLALPSQPIQSPPSTSTLVYDTRTLDDKVSHHSSAGVNFRSACARAFLPVLRNSKDSPLPPADLLPPPSQQIPYQLPIKTLQLNDQAGDTLVTEQGMGRILSDSFGTFQDQPGRFDERPYRLLPDRGPEEKEREKWVGEMDGGKRRVYHNGGLNPLKARPWLRK